MGKYTAYNVPLKSLQPGHSAFGFHLGKQFFLDMEDPDIHDADLDVKLGVDLKGDIYNLHFTITGTITLLCDRCLDELVMPVDTTYDIAVQYGDSFNDDSDSLLIIPSSNPSLNVAYMLHDTVALTIPIKHVHPAGKCNKAMSAMLRKHGAGKAGTAADDEEREMMENLAGEIDSMPEPSADERSKDPGSASDPRWDALRQIRLDDATDH